MYFRECEYCGASLDPGEKCDCQERKAVIVFPVKSCQETDGQMEFDFEKVI